jgi:hypothetical protein
MDNARGLDVDGQRISPIREAFKGGVPFRRSVALVSNL